MEIEAKFIIPDATTARKLRTLARVGAFDLTAPRTLRMRDTFFDTRAHALRAVRYVLRVRRRSDGKTFVTLKMPTTMQGAIHSRPEIEFLTKWQRTPRAFSRAQLPSKIAAILKPLAHDALLTPMFSITQTRHVRAVRAGRRIVAEWSVDRVEMRAGEKYQVMYELEIELKRTGTRAELEEFSAALQSRWNLKPQTKSKFERALVLNRRV